MTIIKKILFFIIIVFLISCNTNKQNIAEKKEKNSLKEYKYIFLFTNKILLFNNNLNVLDSFLLNDTINNYYNMDNIYLTGEYLYTLSKNNLHIVKENIETNTKIPIAEDKYIMILTNEILIKSKYKQYSLIKTDLPIKDVWINPLHNYIYILDSLNYLYSLNYNDKILKRKIYIGKIKNLQFEKLGTRIYIITDNNFIILDYETLNIIYEKKGTFISFCENNKYSYLFLLNTKNQIEIINSINYNTVESIEKNNTQSIVFNNDSLTAVLFDKLYLQLFTTKKIIDIKLPHLQDSILYFNNNYIFFSYKDSISVFDISEKRVICNISNGNFLHIFAIPIDSNNINYNTFIPDKNTTIRQLTEKKKIEHFYSIQIYSFSDMFSAQKAVEKEKNKFTNINFFIKKYKKQKEKIFRVYAGKFKSKKEANIFKKELLKKGYKNDIFSTYISSENIIE